MPEGSTGSNQVECRRRQGRAVRRPGDRQGRGHLLQTMIALKGRNENAMPHWKFDVTETLTQTSHYVVEAATYDLARRKAAIGDTVSEEKIRVHGVQDSDPQ